MCTLSDRDLRPLLYGAAPLVWPVEDCQRQPASIDLRLGLTLRRFRGPRDCEGYECRSDGEPFILQAGEFALGCTLETLRVPGFLEAVVDGKSSWARQGLSIHMAGYVDPGFTGEITLELKNISDAPLELAPGCAIAQVRFQRLSSPAERPYGHPDLRSRYQGQHGPTAARVCA